MRQVSGQNSILVFFRERGASMTIGILKIRWGSGISPIWLSPIGESPLYVRQYIRGLSPLANVLLAKVLLVNIPPPNSITQSNSFQVNTRTLFTIYKPKIIEIERGHQNRFLRKWLLVHILSKKDSVRVLNFKLAIFFYLYLLWFRYTKLNNMHWPCNIHWFNNCCLNTFITTTWSKCKCCSFCPTFLSNRW